MKLRYLLDTLLPMARVALTAFFLYGLGQIIFTDMEKSQARYELCIASGGQWIKGNCVK